MEHPTQLRSALSLAIAAGDIAAAETRRIALGNREPDESQSENAGLIARWFDALSGSAVTGLQVERTRRHLDEFVKALDDFNEHVASPDERIDTSSGWAVRLNGSARVSADIHNEVTATLADLGRYRTNIVLGRPLLGSEPLDS